MKYTSSIVTFKLLIDKNYSSICATVIYACRLKLCRCDKHRTGLRLRYNDRLMMMMIMTITIISNSVNVALILTRTMSAIKNNRNDRII